MIVWLLAIAIILLSINALTERPVPSIVIDQSSVVQQDEPVTVLKKSDRLPLPVKHHYKISRPAQAPLNILPPLY